MKSGLKEYRDSTKSFSGCRKTLNLSLRDVYKATGIHFSNIQRMEHGKQISVVDYLTLMEWMHLQLTEN